MIWFTLALFVVSFIATALLAPKPQLEDSRASNLGDLRFPTASEGSPKPLIFGKIRMRGPNTVWFGDFEARPIKEKIKTGIFSSKTVVVGHRYFVGLDLALCLGPDVVLTKIWIDKDEIWSGTASGVTAVSINKPELFGGYKEGGGFIGTLRFYGGAFNQAKSSYIQSAIQALDPTEDYPACVGVCHVVCEKVEIGEQPTLKPISFELERYPDPLGLAASNVINEDLNPASMLYEAMTATWGGLDIPTSELDSASFSSVGEVLFLEGNGISLAISKPNSGKQVVEEVLRQIDGILYQDPSTGMIGVRLIRADYDILDLTILDETSIVAVRSVSRTSWAETYNQTRVNFTNRANKYENAVAIMQDLANISQQQRVRTTGRSYPGVTNGQLAVDLATRDLSRAGVPLMRATLEFNRRAGLLLPGEVFLWSWPDYGIEQVVMRVQKFNLGELLNGKLVIDCVQDEFGLNQTVFAAPQLTNSVPITVDPVAPATRVMAAPNFFVRQQLDVPFPPAASQDYIMALARRPNAEQASWFYEIEQGAILWRQTDKVDFSKTAVLVTPIASLDGFATGALATLQVNSVSGSLEAATTVDARKGRNLFSIGDELFTHDGFTDLGGGVFNLLNVRRALLDTAPLVHSAGATLFFLDHSAFSDEVFATASTLTARAFSTTIKGASSPTTTVLTAPRRYERPLRPANLNVAAARTSLAFTVGLEFTVSWNERDRLSNQVPDETGATETPEAGTTYDLRVFVDAVQTQLISGIATNSQLVTIATAGAVRIEIESSLGGLVSLNRAFLVGTST
jgi:hypothetical protein